MYDKDEEHRRRELEALKAKEAKLRDDLAALNKKTRSAKSRLVSARKHENWHARRLAALDMAHGYTGEMASARIYVRSLPFAAYVKALEPHAVGMRGADNLSIEIAAVRANYDEWHRHGEEIVLDRERQAAAADRAAWEDWQKKNPGVTDWRDKPITRRQYFLVSRTAEQLGIRMPGQMSRGQASDWLAGHGANLRLVRQNGPDAILGVDGGDQEVEEEVRFDTEIADQNPHAASATDVPSIRQWTGNDRNSVDDGAHPFVGVGRRIEEVSIPRNGDSDCGDDSDAGELL